MGSPHYIAPEQARNHSPDQRCDIYSLGVLLYHMLTGKVPFTAQAPVDIILKHLHEAPVPPRQLRPDLQIAPQLQEIVLKCIAKSRDERFQSMDEMLAELKIVRTQVTGLSGPNSLPPPSYNADTAPNLQPVNPALVAQTPPTAQPSMQTPSQPMPAVRTPAAGSPHIVRPPPPPPEAMLEDDAIAPIPIQQRVTPAYGMRSVPPPAPRKPSRLRAALVVPAALAAAGAVAAVLYLRASSAQVVVQQIPPPAPAVVNSSVAPAPAAAASPAQPGGYQTANAGTTLVSVTSTPSGAEVRDVDDRLLGMTPFDLRVPAAKPLQLTLRHEGFKPVTLKKKPEGDRISLSVTMKKDAKTDPYEIMPNKRSVGYKDDPY
jgi:serine/threonine-protein kinase